MKSFDDWVKEMKQCSDCKSKTWLFLTDKMVSCCQWHWNRIAELSLEWSQQEPKK